MKKKLIPIFYACDTAYAKFAEVSISSVIKNASHEHIYQFHILNTDLSAESVRSLRALEREGVEIIFNDVADYLYSVEGALPLRDRFSSATYFRLFIAEMFPEYDKAIYLDVDTVVNGDISELYLTDIADAYVGACHEQAMVQIDEYGTYAERVVGISRHNFFNAGVMIINCRLWRKKLLKKFSEYLELYKFSVTQDGGYLNLICKDHVFWLEEKWNTQVLGGSHRVADDAKIYHYSMLMSKPWHYGDCPRGDVFWKYAKETSVYKELIEILNSYTEEDRARDAISYDNLLKLAVAETNKEDNFLNIMMKKRAKDRVDVVRKIEEYEKAGRFDEDVEEDPPSRTLMPDEIDYFRNSPIKKLKTKFAFGAARKFVYKLLEEKKMIVKEIRGIENFRDLESGAVITCNHFNAFDSFAIQIAYEAAEQDHRTFYRVIREGNYTSFPGFYGRLMRNCNTLPLSSNSQTMRKFMDATNVHLRNGNFVLFYPEQSMWWNYRKPKPLKEGAYFFAAKNGVPVLPCFITMKDSDILGEDGFYVQEYTIHVGKPIYPDETKSHRENIRKMMDENAKVWREIYESEYSMPLVYESNA